MSVDYTIPYLCCVCLLASSSSAVGTTSTAVSVPNSSTSVQQTSNVMVPCCTCHVVSSLCMCMHDIKDACMCVII